MGILVVVLMLFSAINRITPATHTRSRMLGIETRIRQHFTEWEEGDPICLTELPDVPGKNNAITDGWGNPIVVCVQGSTITLISYGNDGKPGGSGERADISHGFMMNTHD
jgi:hypothetical protein